MENNKPRLPGVELKPRFAFLAQEGRWDDYISALADEGLKWWFDMEIPLIAVHLAALRGHVDQGAPPPVRIAFLMESVQNFMSPDRFDSLYHIFINTGDLEGASAASSAAVASIWDSGTDFNRFPVWYERMDKLMAKSPSSLAIAGLFGFKALVEYVFFGDIRRTLFSYKSQYKWADTAGSNSLKVFSAAGRTYPLLLCGDFSELEVVMVNTAPLAGLADTSMICKVYFQGALGLFYTVKGKVAEGIKTLREVVNMPIFEMLQPSIQLLTMGNLLLAEGVGGNSDEVERISSAIIGRVVREGNYFHQAYAHYNIGVASLLVGRPYKAHKQALEAIEVGEKSGSPIHERMNSLLLAQALADMEELDSAEKIFSKWIGEWNAQGATIMALTAHMELANLLLKKGRIEDARERFSSASGYLPRGEKMPALYRPAKFLDRLEKALSPAHVEVTSWAAWDTAPVRIEVFGELKVNIMGKTIYDRGWRGRSTKNLLKAIIACGGVKVSLDTLCDMLYPTTPRKKAAGNFKVTKWRLIRIGCVGNEEPLPWIALRSRRVSLIGSLCAVDSLLFEQSITSAREKGDDPDAIIRSLKLYKGDFLANDTDQPWIIRHREQLANEYVSGVVELYEICRRRNEPDIAAPYIQTALDVKPLQEDLYALMMRYHINAGYPSKAILAFRRAREILKAELGIGPGPVLLRLAGEAGYRD